MLSMMFVSSYIPVGFIVPLTLIYMVAGKKYAFYGACLWTAANGYSLWLTSDAIIQASLTTVIDLYAKGNNSVWMSQADLNVAIANLSVFLPLVAAALVLTIPPILVGMAALAAWSNKRLYTTIKTVANIHG